MSSQSVDSVQGMLGRSSGVVLFFGLASIVLGVLLMVFTEQSVVFFAVITGIYLILSGLFMIVASFQPETGGSGHAGVLRHRRTDRRAPRASRRSATPRTPSASSRCSSGWAG